MLSFSSFFWCRLSSARICALRAVSTGVPTKQRQAHVRDPSANTHPRSSRSTGAPCIEKSSWRGDVSLRKSTHFCRDLLLIISFQKNIKILLLSGSLFFFLKKRKTPLILYGKDSFGSPKTLDNRSIQICQLEKDTERTFCLQSPQWGRQRAQYGLFTSV